MRRNDLKFAAGFCNAMQLIHETEHVGNMFNDVPANYFFKLIISERIWKESEIMNHVCMTQTIRIDPDCAGKFVLTTTDIKDLFLR